MKKIIVLLICVSLIFIFVGCEKSTDKKDRAKTEQLMNEINNQVGMPDIKEFYEKNPQVVKDFLAEYKTSVAYTNEHVEEAAALSGKYEIIAEAVAKKAIPACNIVYVDGDEMKTMTESFLKVLYEADAKSVGGKLPTAEFYLK